MSHRHLVLGTAALMLLTGCVMPRIKGAAAGGGLATGGPIPGLAGTPSPAATPAVSAYMVETLAGTGNQGYLDDTALKAEFFRMNALALDPSGQVIYVADSGNRRIRRVAEGRVTTLAGDGGTGRVDGPGAAAQFGYPNDLLVAPGGVLYVTDFLHNALRKVTSDGVVSTVAGNGVAGAGEGPPGGAVFNHPGLVGMDAAGTIYVRDINNFRVCKVTQAGFVSVLAGSGVEGSADGVGKAAQFGSLGGGVVAPDGTVYVSDRTSHRIRKITADGAVTTLAGSGTQGHADGPGATAQFHTPCGLALAPDGALFVADTGNHRLRHVASDGTVSTIAGSGTPGFLDGPSLRAQFSDPVSLAVAGDGSLILADFNNNRLRRLHPIR